MALCPSSYGVICCAYNAAYSVYNSIGELHLFVTNSLAIIPALTLLKKMQSPGTELYQQAPNKAGEKALHDAERGPALKATATLGPVDGTSQANGQHRQ